MTIRFCVILAIAAVLVSGVASTAKAQELDSRVTSIFLFNFAKQIQWPTQAESGDFVIGVLGNSPVINDLKNTASQMKIRGRTVVIKQISGVTQLNELKTCHMVFVTRKESKTIKTLTEAFGNDSILVVSEGEGQKGSGINLFLDEEASRPKFELSKPILEKQGLKAASTLLSLAILI